MQAIAQNIFSAVMEVSAVKQPATLNRSVHFKIAATEQDLQTVFRLRYEVLVETDRYYPPNETRMINDGFDMLETTSLIMAMDGNNLIGTVRLILDSEYGLPSDEYFAVASSLDRTKLLGDLSRIAVRKEYRNFGLAFELMRVGQTIGLQLGVNQFVGVSNPKAFSLFQRLGWESVGQVEHSAKYGVPFIPIKAEKLHARTLGDSAGPIMERPYAVYS